VLDLTVEWAEVPSLRSPGTYRLLAVLDGTAPTAEQLAEAVAWLRARTKEGTVLVHCALGHGRSACVVVAYLLAEGKHSTPREAEAFLRRLRPGVRLNAAQRRAVQGWHATGSTG
jgi:protein-tyrosine phosphatase